MKYSGHDDLGPLTPRRVKKSNNPVPPPVKVNPPKNNKHLTSNVNKSKVVNNNQAQSSVDRMRVDLIRSKLSTRMAEEKTAKLEVELKEMKRKYETAQKALSQRKQPQPSNRNSGMQQYPNKKQQQAPLQSGGRSAGTLAPASEPQIGNNFDSLPPFAAALAANAEREEMEKRRRRGLIEESEMDFFPELSDLDEDVLPLAENDLLGEVAILGQEKSTVDIDGNTTVAVRSAEDRLSSLIDEKKKFVSSSEDKVLLENFTSIVESVGDFSNQVQNAGVIPINDELIHPIFTVENDDIQTLRQKCILLNNQRSILQHKLTQSEELRRAQSIELKSSMTSERVLRGLQADWHRGLSEKRKEMDSHKEEWEKTFREKKREWETEKEDLMEKLTSVEDERDMLLMNQQDLTFVMALFCGLLRERVKCAAVDGKSKLLPASNSTSFIEGNHTWAFANSIRRSVRVSKGQPTNKMLTVGGATNHSSIQNKGRQIRDSSLVQGFLQKVKSITQRAMQTRRSLAHEMASPPRNTSTNSASTPSLVTMKRRRSRLYCPPETVLESLMPTKTDASVPTFLRTDR